MYVCKYVQCVRAFVCVLKNKIYLNQVTCRTTTTETDGIRERYLQAAKTPGRSYFPDEVERCSVIFYVLLNESDSVALTNLTSQHP